MAAWHLLDEIVWSRFWAIPIWLVLLFFAYAYLHELARPIGRDHVLGMLSGMPRSVES